MNWKDKIDVVQILFDKSVNLFNSFQQWKLRSNFHKTSNDTSSKIVDHCIKNRVKTTHGSYLWIKNS